MKDERCGVLDVSSRVCCWGLWGSEGVGERRGLGWVYQRGGVCGGLGQGTEVRFDICITYVLKFRVIILQEKHLLFIDFKKSENITFFGPMSNYQNPFRFAAQCVTKTK